jgi:hypothetical protein
MRPILFASMGVFFIAASALAAAELLATADGEAPGVSLEIHQLKASNGTVLLTFTIKNDGEKEFDPDSLNDTMTGKTPDYHSISGVYLTDAANKKKYLVMYDTANQCLCSRGTQNIHPKSSANLWAKFPAPPDNVKKVGITIPHFLPIEDVPISR